MKEITITIATRNRFDKLMRCLGSIPWLAWGDNLKVIVCCDGDHDTFNRITGCPFYSKLHKTIYVSKHQGSPACHNLMATYANDGLLFLMDDMTLFPETLTLALESFNSRFPDDDGVLGLNQEGVKGSESGIALIGQKFLQRFPDKKYNFPDYWHFSDMEFNRLARSLGRFHFDPMVRVYHYHPDTHLDEKDETHYEARKRKTEDLALAAEREAAGLLWGYGS